MLFRSTGANAPKVHSVINSNTGYIALMSDGSQRPLGLKPRSRTMMTPYGAVELIEDDQGNTYQRDIPNAPGAAPAAQGQPQAQPPLNQIPGLPGVTFRQIR